MVKGSVGWVLGIDVIDGLIIYREGTITVIQGGVGGEDGVVALNSSCADLGARLNRDVQLGLLAITDRFHQQGREPRTSIPTKLGKNLCPDGRIWSIDQGGH